MKTLTAAVLAAVVAISVAGCGKSPSGKEILDKASATYSKVKTLKVEAENGTEQRFDNEWRSNGSVVLTEFEKPNKIRQQTVGAAQPSVVSDGKKAYFYMDQGEMKGYIEVPPERVVDGLTGAQSGVHVLRMVAGEDIFKDAKGIKLVGEEKIGDTDTYVVEFIPTLATPLRGLEKAKLSNKVWIGKDDSRLYKGVFIIKQTMKAKDVTHNVTITLTSLPTKQDIDAKIAPSEFALPKGAKTMQMPQMMQPPTGGGR
jgi:outer membrane lipoprotein-sorting protein